MDCVREAAAALEEAEDQSCQRTRILKLDYKLTLQRHVYSITIEISFFYESFTAAAHIYQLNNEVKTTYTKKHQQLLAIAKRFWLPVEDAETEDENRTEL